MNDILLSIVIPVYNVEFYIERCLKSLQGLSLAYIEIVIVDDGSTDNSYYTCVKFSERFPNIKIIRKVNGGLSDARNVGVDNSRGKFIFFLDSDDYVPEYVCDYLIRIITHNSKVDIIRGNAKVIDDTGKIVTEYLSRQTDRPISGAEYLKIAMPGMNMAAWLNIYRRAFLVENELKFKKGLLHEDQDYTPRVFLKANRIITVRGFTYIYCLRQGSITRRKNLRKNAEDLLNSCKSLEVIYNEIPDEILRNKLKDSLVRISLSAYNMGEFYNTSDYCKLDNEFLKRNAFSKSSRIKALLFCLNRKVYKIIRDVFHMHEFLNKH